MNKFKLSFAIIIAILIGTIFIGCEKENELISSENEAEENTVVEKSAEINIIQYIYNIDNKQVSETVFNQQQDDLLTLLSGKHDKELKKDIITIDAFTTEEKYIAFGEKNNIKLKEQIQFENHMREYVEENGIEEIYEKTGKVPQSYLDYEKQYHEKVFGKMPENKALAVAFHKDFWGQGSTALMFNTCPFMWPGWNNETSSLLNVGVYGVLTLYDRTFYRSRLTTIWNWGMSFINLWGCNDMTSSAVLWY